MFALCIESSHARGMGHFYRALNLADGLKQAGFGCKFYLNDHKPSLAILSDTGYAHEVVNLEDYASSWEKTVIERDLIKCWVNDRHSTDTRHSARVKASAIPLITFDDRGSGASLADMHIAALAFDPHEKLGGAKVLCGVEYLVLNPQILNYTRVRKRLSSILVTLGGSDTYGVTVKAVQMLSAMNFPVTVVIGPAFMHNTMLEKVLTDQFTLKRCVPSIIEEFSKHDLAITGGGITPFEANASGLPCIVIANELFEIPVGVKLQRQGGAIFAGHHEALHLPLFNADLPLEQMSLAGMSSIGLEGTSRVIKAMLELLE